MASNICVVIFFLLGSVYSSPLFVSENARKNDESLKIINGDFTNIDKYPIDVAFLISNNIWGAGVIINSSWILTTAFNCFWVDPSYITVRVGSTNWSQGGNIIPAEYCVIHPDYTGTWANNIALVKLAGSVSYGPDSRQGYYIVDKTLNIPGASYDVSGWGVRSSSYAKEINLQSISQTVLDNTECSKFYNMTAATGSFCASNPKGGPCVFDFGAPLNRRRTVVGLYQGSVDCTQPQTYPALYVDVFPYTDWITSIMVNS